jgi:hypothetical protein
MGCGLAAGFVPFVPVPLRGHPLLPRKKGQELFEIEIVDYV